MYTHSAFNQHANTVAAHCALLCSLCTGTAQLGDCMEALSQLLSHRRSLAGSDSGIHMHRHSFTQAHTHTGAHSHGQALSRSLSLSLLRNTFRARLRSQRAQLNEPRPQRTVSLQSVVGQSTRTQLALLSHKRNQIEGAQSEKNP